ncbi:hypothetical protein GALL_520760 [mine drainage metagenome]|uniref:Uncharacterized protein n=1 Tax=mine drainage metagenome TaxID=410659 RepID=A0A1J5PFP0_9ZZZZ
MAVAISPIVQVFRYDHIGHGDQRGCVGGGANEHMLIGQLLAGHRYAWIDANDTGSVIPSMLEVLHCSGTESSVAGTPAPHQDQFGIDEIRRLPPRRFVVVGAIGDTDGKHLGFG